MLALLDANAWLNFHRREPAARRSRFQRAVQRGLVRPLLTPLVLSELAQAPDHAEVDRVASLRYAWTWSRGRVLLPDFEREDRELRLRRPLREVEALYDDRQRANARAALDSSETAEWARRVIPPAHVQHETAERARLEATVAELDSHQLREALGDLPSRQAFARSWASDAIAERANDLGLAAPHVAPDRAPTFLAAKAVHVERIARVLLEGRTPVQPDRFDVQHLEDALAYCDLVVSDDARLVALGEVVGAAWPKLRVSRLDPWLESLPGATT